MKSILEVIDALKAIEPAGRFRYYLALLLLALITGCLDMLSVALVFGVVAAIVKPEMLESLPLLGDLTSPGNPLAGGLPIELVIGIALVTLVIAKNLLKIYFNYYQSRLVNDWVRHMTCRLYSIYMNAPYLFHKQANSAELIRNSVTTINASYAGIIKALVVLATNCLMMSMVAFVLLYLQPLPAVIAGGLVVLLVLGQNLVFSGLLQRIGAEHYALAGKNLRQLMQGFGAIKEIRILGREEGVHRTFNAVQRRWARLRHIHQFVSAVPAQIAELSLIFAIVALVAILIVLERDTGEIIPLIALFAAAASRILPAAGQVISSLHQINMNLPGLRILRCEINHPWGEWVPGRKGAGHALPFRNEIRFDRVSFDYPDSDGPAVNGIDLVIPRGEYLGIVGGSGAGKSTVIDLLLGLLTPRAGRITVDGSDIATSLESWQANIGYVPQEIFITDDTIRANVAFGLPPEEIEDDKVWQALKLAQLDGFVGSLSEGLNTVLGERGDRLSGGQRQRIGIARALYREPAVLVFDEPTSDLDIDIEREISNTLLSLKGSRTIVVVAHRLAMLNHCDRILVMSGGRIARECSYQELIDTGSTLEDPPASGQPVANVGVEARR